MTLDEHESQEPQSGKILMDVPPKILCWLAIMCAVVDLYYSILNLTGNCTYDGNQAANSSLIMLVGFLGFIVAILAAVIGVFGLQCEKNPSKAKPLFVICIVAFVLSLLYCAGIFSLDAGSLDMKFAAAQAAIFLILTVCANTTKKSLQ